MKFNWKLTPAIVLLLFLPGCFSESPKPSDPNQKVTSMELFYSRSSWNETEFEQFQLVGGKLFQECGEIRHGRYLAKEQKIKPLTSESTETLQTRLDKIARYMLENSPSFDDPGDNVGLADPGVFSFRAKYGSDQVEIETSYDSISAPSSYAEKRLKKVVQAVRASAGGILCGNASFYGIGFER